MKATIENSLTSTNSSVIKIYVQILNIISSSKGVIELRKRMLTLSENTDVDSYFDWGYGGSHMWVHEINKRDRLIFVKF